MPYNIKKADWDNFDSQEKYIEWSIKWIKQASRVLKLTGSLYVCGFSEILADLKHPASKYFKHCRWLIWHYKNKANLGNRGAKPKDVMDIPTTCNGMGEKTPHPTQKPEELVRKFVLASSNEGDLVIDPFSGSGPTAVVAEQLNRHWMACDLDPQYNQWAIERLEGVRRKTKDEWIAYDRKTAARRESIR